MKSFGIGQGGTQRHVAEIHFTLVLILILVLLLVAIAFAIYRNGIQDMLGRNDMLEAANPGRVRKECGGTTSTQKKEAGRQPHHAFPTQRAALLAGNN